MKILKMKYPADNCRIFFWGKSRIHYSTAPVAILRVTLLSGIPRSIQNEPSAFAKSEAPSAVSVAICVISVPISGVSLPAK